VISFLRDFRCTCAVVVALAAYLGGWALFTTRPPWDELRSHDGSMLVIRSGPPTALGALLYRGFLPLVLVNAHYRRRFYVYDFERQFRAPAHAATR
jgi:hypothetical protein